MPGIAAVDPLEIPGARDDFRNRFARAMDYAFTSARRTGWEVVVALRG